MRKPARAGRSVRGKSKTGRSPGSRRAPSSARVGPAPDGGMRRRGARSPPRAKPCTYSPALSLMEVVEEGHDPLPGSRHPVQPVTVPHVDRHARRRTDPERISFWQLGRDPNLESPGEPDPVLRLLDGRQVARRISLPLVHPPADALHHPGKDAPGIGVESEADALPGPEVFEAVLPVVGDDPPRIPVDAGEDRRAHVNVGPLPELNVGDVPIGGGVDTRPLEVE